MSNMAMSEQILIDTSSTTILHMLGKQKEPKRLRYMHRDGGFPVHFQNAQDDWSRYLADIFTTLVEIRWRCMLLAFSLSYILSWLFFGLCYWLIAYVNGDVDDPENPPCVENVRGFTAAFMFSMETQATIGYGFRGMTENCMGAIVVVTVQDVFSCLLDTVVIGVVCAKMASARKRAQTVGFSKCAVVHLRDGVLCLSWRLGDFRGNHILEGVARAMLVRHVRTKQGSLAWSYQELEVENPDLVLATPVTIVHKIEPSSPLYRLSPDDLLDSDNLEVVVSFTYTGDSTGMLHQTRTSYTPKDFRWGQRFREMLRAGKRRFKADYALFNDTEWTPVPQLCAEELDRRRRRPVLKINPEVTEEVMEQTCL